MFSEKEKKPDTIREMYRYESQQTRIKYTKKAWVSAVIVCLYYSNMPQNYITELELSWWVWFQEIYLSSSKLVGFFILSFLPRSILNCLVSFVFEWFYAGLFMDPQLQKKIKGFPHPLFHDMYYKYRLYIC